MGAGRAGAPAQCGGEGGLPFLDLLGAPALLVAEAKPLLGGVEQAAQQLPLPVVPGAGTDGADIDNGEDEQQP